MMKQQLKFKWQQIIPKPDPIYGIPLPRSSHGVSILRPNNTTTTLFLYGGEHIARTPIDYESSCWICDLTNIKSIILGNQSKTTTTTTTTTTSNKVVVVEEEEHDAIWKRVTTTDGGRQQQDGLLLFPPPRIAHAQAVYKNRYVYIFGGRAGITTNEQAMNDLWVLDTTANTDDGSSSGSNSNTSYHDYIWTLVEVDIEKSDALPEPRSYHRMICIDDALYVFGGCGSNGRLNDLYKFDIIHRTWHNLGRSTELRGRGGTNMIPLKSNTQIAIVAGFAGEEMNDGHIYDIEKQRWELTALTPKLDGVRPRSVCVNASFTKNGIAVIFGGEVNPSDLGHVGAGAFANDIVVLDEQVGFHVATIPSPHEKLKEKKLAATNDTTGSSMNNPNHMWHDRDMVDDVNVDKYSQPWPMERGWSDMDYYEDLSTGIGYMYMFGGLTGDDTNPIRLNDLWKLEVSHM